MIFGKKKKKTVESETIQDRSGCIPWLHLKEPFEMRLQTIWTLKWDTGGGKTKKSFHEFVSLRLKIAKIPPKSEPVVLSRLRRHPSPAFVGGGDSI